MKKGPVFFLAQSVYSKLREKRLGLCRVSWCALQSFRVINWYQSIARMRFVIGYKIWSQKTRFLNGLHDDENRIILRRLVLTHYHRVTDRRTDGRTLLHSRCATKSVQRWSFSSVKQKNCVTATCVAALRGLDGDGQNGNWQRRRICIRYMSASFNKFVSQRTCWRAQFRPASWRWRWPLPCETSRTKASRLPICFCRAMPCKRGLSPWSRYSTLNIS